MRRLIDPKRQGEDFASRMSGYDSQRDQKSRASISTRYETETQRIVPSRRSETLGPWYRGALSGTTTVNAQDGFITGTNTTTLVTGTSQPMSQAGRVVGGRLLTDTIITAGTVVLRIRVIDADGVTTVDTDLPDCTLDSVSSTRVSEVNVPHRAGVPFHAGSSVIARLVATSLAPSLNLKAWLVVEYDSPL